MMAKVLTSEDIKEFKLLKHWCRTCPAEAAMRIQKVEEANGRLTTDLFERIEYNGNLAKQKLDATKEIERLRKALEFYAEETKYERVELCDGEKEIYIERDGGEIARQALEGDQ